jgi:hypothetical protein
MKEVFGSRVVMGFRARVMIEKRFNCRGVIRFRGWTKYGFRCRVMMKKGFGCRRAVMTLRDRGQVMQKWVIVEVVNCLVNWEGWKGSPGCYDCLWKEIRSRSCS